jgi:hypothetical protein
MEVACLYFTAFSSSEEYAFSSDSFSSCSLHWQLLGDPFPQRHNLLFRAELGVLVPTAPNLWWHRSLMTDTNPTHM